MKNSAILSVFGRIKLENYLSGNKHKWGTDNNL